MTPRSSGRYLEGISISENPRIVRYDAPAGGWGSVRSLFTNATLSKTRLSAVNALLHQNTA